MPLVVPGLMGSSSSADKTSDWQNKLLGKTLGEQSDETTFAKRDLPSEHRVVREGDMVSLDHKPDRLNVHVDDKGTVTKVTHG